LQSHQLGGAAAGAIVTDDIVRDAEKAGLLLTFFCALGSQMPSIFHPQHKEVFALKMLQQYVDQTRQTLLSCP
jgi:hypothetical protein